MDRAQPATTPRKRPKQARAKALVDAVLEAAARILDEGEAGFTTNAIAERAGVSIGSLYQYFPTREAIAAELIRAKRARMLADIDAAAATGATQPLPDAIHAVARAAIAHQAQSARLAKALEGIAAAPWLRDETDALNAAIADRIGALLAAHRVRDPQAAGREAAALARGAILDAAAHGIDDPDALAARVSRAITAWRDAWG